MSESHAACIGAIKAIAAEVRSSAKFAARERAALRRPEETAELVSQAEEIATELDHLAEDVPGGGVTYPMIEERLARFRKLGGGVSGASVSEAARAFTATALG